MTQADTIAISAQRRNVKRVSAVIQVLIYLGMAFTGIGITLHLLGIVMSGSLRVDLAEGDVDISVYRLGDESVAEAQMLLVPHEETARDGLLYRQPAVEPPAATVPLSSPLRGMLAVIALINGAAVMYLLEQLSRLFGHYQRGEIFTSSVVNTIRHTGLALLAFPAAALLNSVAGIAMVAALAPQLTFTDVSLNVDMLFAALLLIMVSWIMDEGRRLNEENELTI